MSRLSQRIGLQSLAVTLLAVIPAASHHGEVLAAEKKLTVQGRVVLEDGSAMPRWPVSLIGTSRYVELGKHTSGGDITTIASVTTDENGYYSIDVPRPRRYHFFFLRFVSASHLDPVKYQVPDDVEITASVRRNRVASVVATVRHHRDWAELTRRIAEAGGEETPRGRILRKLGLPEKSVVSPESGEEEWWYFTKGVLYTFRGPEPTGSRRFDPVPPPQGEGR